MSSEQKNIINLGNYEEFFVLYMDNELTSIERTMVEHFLVQYPDLKCELDLLMSTKLPVDDISFSNKSELLASQMKIEDADNKLLLYIDDELTGAERKSIEEQLTTTPEFQSEYRLLLQTKLDAKEQISYPNKKELYRTTAKTVQLQWVWRVAAVVLVVLSATILWLASDTSTINAPSVADNSPKSQPSSKPKAIEVSPIETNQIAVSVNKEQKATTEKVSPQYAATQVDNAIAYEAPVQQEEAVLNPIIADKGTVAEVNVSEISPNTAMGVTNETPGAYNDIDNASQSAAADSDEDSKGKGSFKGFLRKATRLIERNTGIVAANDDNQLLIGVVAVKLK